MPLHDLKCNTCSKTSEWLVRASDLNSAGELNNFECPHCGNTQCGYTKIISINTSFQLKGEGWFSDGYSSSSKNSTRNSE